MTGLYQAPLTPGYNSTAVGNISGSNLATTRSPFFSISNQFLPRNLHDVIRWARYITTQSPVTTEVVRKLATYPVTDFIVDSERQSTKDKYEEVFSSLKLKSTLHDVGFEYFTIGNVFLSIYFPIHRTLHCPNCKADHNAKKATFAKFTTFEFKGQCPSCGSTVTFERKDTKSSNIPDINIIKWDPLNIAVSHNPITNEYEYYYKIPNEIKRRVKQGDKLFVNSVPWSFIEAIKNNQDYKFDEGNLFHLKNVSTGQMVEGISIPPLISQFSLVFYQATLRKANESVAQDYMAPLRIVYPTAQTGNSDPVISLSMRNFAANMQNAIIKHKQDNNHVLIAPVPVGYQAVSGEGKSLLVTQEIAQAEESILLSLGVSRELLTGTTNWTSSTVGLRMLENTLYSYTDQIESFIEWVMAKVTKYLTLETCKVELAPFKLTDDESLRQVLFQLVQQGGASLSDLYESYGMNYEDVLKKIREDAVAKAINDAKTQMEVDRGVFLASKQMADKFDANNDYRTALSKAQQYAEQLHAVDPATQRGVLNQLKIEDYSMYLLVSKLLTEYAGQDSGQLGADGQPVQGGAPGQEAEPGGENSGAQDQGGPNQDDGGKPQRTPQPAAKDNQPKAGSEPKVKGK